MRQLDDFTKSYIECALWSSTDYDGMPFDQHYRPSDIASESLDAIQDDCISFQQENYEILKSDECKIDDEICTEEAGHDFWLTRNGHGAGFWDGNWPEPAGAQLTAAAKAFGMSDLYVGDDGMLHFT